MAVISDQNHRFLKYVLQSSRSQTRCGARRRSHTGHMYKQLLICVPACLRRPRRRFFLRCFETRFFGAAMRRMPSKKELGASGVLCSAGMPTRSTLGPCIRCHGEVISCHQPTAVGMMMSIALMLRRRRGDANAVAEGLAAGNAVDPSSLHFDKEALLVLIKNFDELVLAPQAGMHCGNRLGYAHSWRSLRKLRIIAALCLPL
mmetsp:Transcript_30464/g.66780  ORF Transcript_30464/g.66780 Transcript_30464/m.66780 type:complete len:203 (-) Transcript_30464:78-686(-)